VCSAGAQQSEARKLIQCVVHERACLVAFVAESGTVHRDRKRFTLARSIQQRQQLPRMGVGQPHAPMQQRRHFIAATRLQPRKRARHRALCRGRRKRGRMHVQGHNPRNERVGKNRFERTRQRGDRRAERLHRE